MKKSFSKGFELFFSRTQNLLYFKLRYLNQLKNNFDIVVWEGDTEDTCLINYIERVKN